MAEALEDDLIEDLRRRLHTSGPMPKRQQVVAALSMARDQTLPKAKACDDAGVPRGSRSRAVEYCERILRKTMLPSTNCNEEPWQKKLPMLKPQICGTCQSVCSLYALKNSTPFEVKLSCLSCKAMVPCYPMTEQSTQTYWVCDSKCDPEEPEDGAVFDVMCHSCSTSSTVDWSDVSLACYQYEIDRLFLSKFDEFDEQMVDFCYGDISDCDEPGSRDLIDSARSNDYEIARRLQLPCNFPDPDQLTDPVCKVLVSEDWVEKNAPNIERLYIGKFTVSKDGKVATRTFEATQRDSDGLVFEAVDYEFPPDDVDACDMMGRWRRVAKFREREVRTLKLFGRPRPKTAAWYDVENTQDPTFKAKEAEWWRVCKQRRKRPYDADPTCE